MNDLPIEKYSADEWEHLRKRFFTSILNDIELAKLAQNASLSWPFKGAGETAAKYIEYDFEELKSVPGLIGKKSRIKTLMDILRETLAFDDPFSDMVDKVEADSEIDDTFERLLAKLEIPPNYPAKFIHLEQDTIDMLNGEEVTSLIELIHFSQKIASNVVVGGDLKAFLNGVANKDEFGIQKHLPYRRGERGLHLAEAIGLIAHDLPEVAQLQLLENSEDGLNEEETQRLNSIKGESTEAVIEAAVKQVDEVSKWFTAEAAELKQLFREDGLPERYFISINNPRRERIALILAKLHLGIGDGKKAGFLGKLFGR